MQALSFLVLLSNLLFQVAIPGPGARGTQWRYYPTGTLFAESFGNITANSDLCWSGGPSSCDQTWTVLQGSGQTIVTAPSGWGFTSTNVLKIPPAGTPVALDTEGSIPYVAQSTGTTSTLTMQFGYDSTSYTSFNEFLVLDHPGGGHSVSVGFWASGDGQITVAESGGGGCAAAPNTAHTLTVTIGASTTSFQIDGVTCGTAFSTAAQDYYRAILVGDSASANEYFGPITVTSSTVSGGWSPNALIDFAGVSGSVTGANMATATHCGSGGPSAWSVSSLTGLTFAFSTGGTSFTAPLWVCGTTYQGNTNKTLEMLVTTTASSAGWVQGVFNTTYSSAWIGLEMWYTGGPPLDGDGCDVVAIQDQNGTVDNIQLETDGSNNQHWCLENDNAGTSTCVAANISAGTHYWLTFGVSATGADTLYLYDRATRALLGTTAENDRAFVPGITLLLIGKTGSETQSNALDVFYSNVELNTVDANGPITPQ